MCSKAAYLFLLFSILSCKTPFETPPSKASIKNPKLVVAIVVDQMRFEYLNRFKSKYSSQGFLKLMNQGFSWRL